MINLLLLIAAVCIILNPKIPFYDIGTECDKAVENELERGNKL